MNNSLFFLIQYTQMPYSPGKSTFAKPYPSTTGISHNLSLWIAGVFLLFAIFMVFKVRQILKKRENTRIKHGRSKTWLKTASPLKVMFGKLGDRFIEVFENHISVNETKKLWPII
jgi:hypothetical protein